MIHCSQNEVFDLTVLLCLRSEDPPVNRSLLGHLSHMARKHPTHRVRLREMPAIDVLGPEKHLGAIVGAVFPPSFLKKT